MSDPSETVTPVGHADDPDAEQSLRGLLARYPDARVSAVLPSGVSVPVPSGVPLGDGHLRAGEGGVKWYLPEDRPGVIAAFERARLQGMSTVTARTAEDPTVVANVTFIDETRRHGVFLTVSYGQGGVEAHKRLRQTVAEPARIARIRKSGLATIVDVDVATSSILGWTREEMVGHRSLEFIHPDDQGLAIENWMELIANPGPARMVRIRHRSKDGDWIWFEMTQTNQLEGDSPCVLTEMVNISKEMAVQEELAAREQLLHQLTQALPLGVFQIDIDGRVVFANDRFYDIVGLPPTAALHDQFALVEASDLEQLETALQAVLSSGIEHDLEFSIHPLADPPGRCQLSLRALTGTAATITGAIGCISDITKSAVLRRELEDRATFDPLTGCRNRATILTDLDNLLAGRSRTGLGVAVVFIDIDLFKQVNDKLGHAAGDELLTHVAARLQGQLRGTDQLGRIGGDEFLVVCDQVATEADADAIGERITALLDAQVQLTEGAVRLRASVGVAWSAEPSHGADKLIARADTSMYASKRARVNGSVAAKSARSKPSRAPIAKGQSGARKS